MQKTLYTIIGAAWYVPVGVGDSTNVCPQYMHLYIYISYTITMIHK